MVACTAKPGPSAAVYPEAVTADEILFSSRCHECHVPPFPKDRAAGAWPLIVSNAICLALSAFILVMKLLPRPKKQQVAEALDPTTPKPQP